MLWWIAAPLVELYAAVSLASVSHRHLFLDAPVALPLLGIAVPPMTLAIAIPVGMLAVMACSIAARIPRDPPLPAPLVIVIAGVAPILVLLQAQLEFLPLHAEALTWFHRAALGAAVFLVGFMRPRALLGAAVAALLFGWTIATFPGEWLHRQSDAGGLLPGWVRPTNTLDLSRQAFGAPVFDGSDTKGPSLRGRRLEGAKFFLTDLRRADFEGARLDGADFVQSDLRGASFHGAHLSGASFGNGALDGVDFSDAILAGASLNATLPGLNFARADLRGALFGFGVPTNLDGANLSGARLEGAFFEAVYLRGADLRGTSMAGATLASSARASDSAATSFLDGANLDGASLQGADLQGASLRGASLRQAQVWRVSGTPQLDAADTAGIDRATRPAVDGAALRAASAENPFRQEQAQRLARLEADSEPSDATPAQAWSIPPPAQAALVAVLADLVCAPSPEDPLAAGSPHVARGLIANGRLAATGRDIVLVAARMKAALRTPSDCPGAAGFQDKDWAALDALVAASSAR